MKFVHLTQTVLIGAGLAACESIGAGPDSFAPIKQSDVVLQYPAKQAVYEQYDATVVAWGFRPWKLSGAALERAWDEQCKTVQLAGLRYQARVEVDAGWRDWIDFDPDIEASTCRTLNGTLLTYHFWTSTYKGKPAYFGCTNAKGYQRFLIHQAREALAINPDMLMIDAIMVTPMSLPHGGCFCDACMDGFRDYLQADRFKKLLKKYGISKPSSFDYGAFLRKCGVTDEQFAKATYGQGAPIPLMQEYRLYQHEAARTFIAEFKQNAERIAGRAIPLCTNSLLDKPSDWSAYPVMDHFTVETPLDASERKIPQRTIFRYQLGEALGVTMAATGLPHLDLKFVRDEKLKGLVRCWIAQAYAYGQTFMVPHSAWCGENEVERYESEPGDCDDLYRFVRAHADLFDGYEPLARVGLLLDVDRMAAGDWRITKEAGRLRRLNIPYRLLVNGGAWIPASLESDDVEGLESVVVLPPVNTADKALLKGRNLKIYSGQQDPMPTSARIRVQGAEKVAVVPRHNPLDPKAPIVCHLLNENYQADRDSMKEQRKFTVTLPASLVPTDIKRATLLKPGEDPVECKVVKGREGIRVTVPSLDVWAMLRLDKGRTSYR
ncbi:hypothetical protein [Pontiella agarivorans]|uniref:Beta-galactosidase trimerisation domain-containing protein n=1 Tax=Pontiella agarivorans TaxID=3038953 RepID=A0ABU5MY11_9BACT|nr:hypothetical protein [Pontiella agarivorans]MDZ8119091.1 hypothetical protein [Pontiella agarivorans]